MVTSPLRMGIVLINEIQKPTLGFKSTYWSR
nr:MAG TPA: hypothetical protein [Caudoviricetes sp.]